MRIQFMFSFLTLSLVLSCSKSPSVNTDLSPVVVNRLNKQDTLLIQPLANPAFIDTHLEYVFGENGKLYIKNSLPKGGFTYTSPLGESVVYAVFWTDIRNETDRTLTFNLIFPDAPTVLPVSPERTFRLVLPNEPALIKHEVNFDYGLDVKSFLDDYLHSKAILEKTVLAGESARFFVVTLFNKPIDGVMRAGLFLKGNYAYYRVNGTEIHCGTIQ